MGNSGKQQLFAFLLIMLVLFLTPKYMEYIAPPQEEEALETILEGEANYNYVEREISEKEKENLNIIDEIHSVDEVVFSVESPLYIAEVSNAGGGTLKSLALKNYLSGFNEEGVFVEDDFVSILIPDENQCSPCLSLRNNSNNEAKFFDSPFSTDIQNGENFVLNEGDSHTFYFNFLDSKGNEISKSITMYGDYYHFDYEINTTSVEEGSFTREVAWTKSLRPTEKNKDYDVTESGAVIWQVDEHEDIAQTSPDKIYLETLDGRTDWAAIKSKYFIASIIPDNKGIYGSFEADNQFFANREITPGYKVYIGHHSNDKVLSDTNLPEAYL